MNKISFMRYILLIILFFFLGQLIVFSIIWMQLPLKLDEYLLNLKYNDHPEDRYPDFINASEIELAGDISLPELNINLEMEKTFSCDRNMLRWLRNDRTGRFRYFITSISRAQSLIDSLAELRLKDHSLAGDECKISGRNLFAENTCLLALKWNPELPKVSKNSSIKEVRDSVSPFFFTNSVSFTAQLDIASDNFINFEAHPNSIVSWIKEANESNPRYYITWKDSVKALRDSLGEINSKFTGENLFARGTVFLTKNSAPDLPSRSCGLLSGYFYWLSQVFQGNLGKAHISSSKVDSLTKVLWENGVINLLWTFIVILFMVLMAYLFAFILVFSKSKILKSLISVFNQVFSAVPDFLLAIFMFIVFYDLLKVSDFEPAFGDKLRLFLIPSLGIAFANGNIAGLSRLLQAKMKNISANDYVNFLRINGLKERFIRFHIILKETVPVIIEYSASKFALIFGAVYIFEKILNIKSLGYIAVEMITAGKAGFILCFFFFINLLVIIINVLAKSAILILSPPLRKKNNE